MVPTTFEQDQLSRDILSEITVFMKYAKYLPDEERRETWDELVDRNMNMHIEKFPQLKEEIEDVYNNFVRTKKVLPSMRSMQFAGRAVELNNARLYNCSYLPVKDIEAFAETMFLLLSGTGVGYSVQKHHVEQLPPIKKPEKTRRFLIDDSITGWADAVKVLMRAYLDPAKTTRPVFDFRDIRPKGARLITSGGKAPGPEPLRICLTKIEALLSEKKTGEKLTTLEAHDIQCHIADAVLSGGIRRAAMIALFSFGDNEMASCKSGAWYELNPQRGRANNSVVLVRHRVDKKSFGEIWEYMRLSGAGEPGFYFTNDKEIGTNPCAEISLKPYGFCVSGDTKLITRAGIERIEDAVGKEIEIWNGEEWSTVSPFVTGTDDKLWRVEFGDGSYLDATGNHKFLVKNRFQKEFQETTTVELIELLESSKYALQVPRSDVVYEGGTQEDLAFDYGYILGDGTVEKNFSTYADLYADQELGLGGVFAGERRNGVKSIRYNALGTEYARMYFPELNGEFAHTLKYGEGLPSRIFSWNKQSILNFIAGWADADGTQASKGIRIYGREDKIRDGQLLLSKVGIDSSVNLMSKTGEVTNYSTRKNDVWYLQITKTDEIPCRRLVCDNPDSAKYKGKYQTVRGVTEIPGTHMSYCVSEEKLHQCVFNNVLTKQCNLTEINAASIINQEDYNARAKAASFIGTLQAAYTDFYYLRDEWKETAEKEALLGVSMTGIASGTVTELNMAEASKVAVEENNRVADLLGINRARRVTTVKPSGTTSLVLGSSSGVHAWHNDYYLRRIRVNKNEAIYAYLLLYHPELVEDEYFSPETTAVITVPQKAPKGAITRHTETAVSLLERVKLLHDEWIKPGHVLGDNTHNVSCTINIKEDEWDEVRSFLWHHRDSFTAVSCLPHSDHTYKQAPFEDCTEEIYETMVKLLSMVNLGSIIEPEDNTSLADNIACYGGASCEVT